MSNQVRGWLFVGIQVCLLLTIVLLPSADHWPTPTWLQALASVLFFAGVGLGIAAALGLGSSLTPTPVPTHRGVLKTGGLYRFMRHPIYTAVLLLVVAMTVRSGNLVTLIIGVGTMVFFNVKARWEEQRLRETYPDYRDYAATTPRFLPFTRPT